MFLKNIGYKRILNIICLVTCLGLLLLGLWPLDFYPKNAVRWIEGQNGLAFQCNESGWHGCAGGVAFTPGPIVIPQRTPTREVSGCIEIWLRPSVEPSHEQSHIVSFYDDSENEMLSVGQWKSDLIVR